MKENIDIRGACFFNSDTFQIRITQSFLEKLKSSKVTLKDKYLTFVSTPKSSRNILNLIHNFT